ncbi:MAG: hypothetical protein HY886_04920, partial [Deltaproteobacteria bacterium]|nr:hypothetical protein [Deltaproteobacteria bacterium]
MKLHLKKGTTSKLLDLFIQDSSSTTGAGLTGLVYNSAGLSAYYYREGAASAVAITLATMTLGTWATGGFVVVDGTNMPGCYQLSVPDAALATGANSVLIILKGATNMAPLVLEVQLTDIDFNDAVRGGMTSLPSSGTLAVNPTLAGVTHTGAVIPTVSTLTGHTAQTGDNYARIGAAGAGLTALGDTRLANLDAAVSTRSTYAGGAVASVTAAVTVGTNNDKTGYSLTQTFPANFSALSITAGGLVDITQAAADKAWSTASRLLTAGTNIVLAKGTGITGFTDVTAAQVSTQVWSEPIPGTFGSGTAGYKLNSAAS